MVILPYLSRYADGMTRVGCFWTLDNHRLHLSSDGDLDLDTGLDVDNDLLDDLGGGGKAVLGSVVSIPFIFVLSSYKCVVFQHQKGRRRYILNETLVDAHLVQVPSLGTLTARSLTGGDLEVLGRQADGALDGQVLALGALNELGADLLEGLDLARGQGDADLVGLLYSREDKMVVSKLLFSFLVSSARWRVLQRDQSRTGASKSPLSPFW